MSATVALNIAQKLPYCKAVLVKNFQVEQGNWCNVSSDLGLECTFSWEVQEGVSVSTNLMLACAARGIRLYVVDWRGVGVVALSGLHQHAVVSLREAQFAAVRSDLGRSIAREMITAKIRNQRAVLLYFWKYLTKSAPDKAERLRQAADQMADFAVRTKGGTSGADPAGSTDSWAAALMGSEGAAAALYWQTLREAELVPATFLTREGRGSVVRFFKLEESA